MKKYILGILMISMLSFFTGCNETKTMQENKISYGNEYNENVFQIKVINDFINIREDASTNNPAIGKVYKDEIYTVLDYTFDTEYIWFHIKTANNIEGYVASDIDSPYVELLNEKDFDYIPPTLNLKVDHFTVLTRNDITLEELNKYIEYSDDSGNVNITWELNTSDYVNNHTFKLTITASDHVGNKTNKVISVEFANELFTSKGDWLTYDQVMAYQKEYESICESHGGQSINNYADCNKKNNDGIQWRRESDGIRVIQYDPTKQFGLEGIMCIYTQNDEVENCKKNNNVVSYLLIEKEIKNAEEKSLKEIHDYEKECLEKTGYTFKDLNW